MANKPFDVVVAGHICVDITPGFTKVAGKNVEDIMKPGSLLIMAPAVISTGGAVSNTGLALRRLGQKVLLMGKCSDDAFGRILVDRLRAEAPGAEKGMTLVRGEPTSYSVVVVPPGIDRIFLHCPGTNDTFDSSDINVDVVRRARLFHFGYPPLMKKLYSDGGTELSTIFRKVKAAGVLTSLDLALPDPNSEAGRANWRGILRKTLPFVDIFVPSFEEILFMVKRNRHNELRRRSGTRDILDFMSADDVREIGRICIDMGAKIVLIKCGKLGAYVRTADQKSLMAIKNDRPDPDNWSSREIWQGSFKARKVVSATGSGDSSIAGFLAAVLHRQTIEIAMRFCCMAGYQNIHVADSVSGIKPWKETSRMVRARMPCNPVGMDMTGWQVGKNTGLFHGPSDLQES